MRKLTGQQENLQKRSLADNLDFILEHLSGEALEEIKHRNRHHVASCEQVFEILIKSFGDGLCSRAQLERQFYNRNQGKGESLRKYSHILMALAEKLTHLNGHEKDRC